MRPEKHRVSLPLDISYAQRVCCGEPFAALSGPEQGRAGLLLPQIQGHWPPLLKDDGSGAPRKSEETARLNIEHMLQRLGGGKHVWQMYTERAAQGRALTRR